MRNEAFDGPESPAYRDRCVTDAFRRIGGVWYSRLESTGDIIETTVRVMRVEAWKDCREASDPTWRPMHFDELVIAVKTLCG